MVSATGFPVTNETWRFIQQAWREPLAAFARVCGEKTILYGVNVALGSASNGYVSYGGEILQFVGGPVNANVTLVEEITTAQYDVDIDNDSVQDTLPQYKYRYLKFGSDGIATFPFADLVRVDTIKAISEFVNNPDIVIDSNYVHTDNNFSNDLLELLQGIVSNVQANWNTTNPASPSFILNKPENLMTYLRKSYVNLGNWPDGNDEQTTIYFPDIGTSSYVVIGSLVSQGDWNNDNDVFWTADDKTSSSFKLLGRRVSNNANNLRFDYYLIPLF